MPEIRWEELGFEFIPTNGHVEYHCRSGEWDAGELKADLRITMSVAATCLHYGQAVFEGLKAFRCQDGKVRVFRDDENCRRMGDSAAYVQAPKVPLTIFQTAIDRVIKANIEFVPPYGTGGSLYVRPLLIGTGPKIGVNASDEYAFIVLVTPVGPYYKGGVAKPLAAMVLEDYDRAAPSGTGCYKVAGNYAASLTPSYIAKKKGYPITLFLDSRTHQFIDEFGTSNFLGITKDGVYVTPESKSILPSITNKSLMRLAEDMDIKVERRPVRFDELPDFAEIGSCGTAVVITPIGKIVRGDTVYTIGDEFGPVLKRLREKLVRIQYGEDPDTHGWLREVK